MANELRDIVVNGLWKQNPGVVQILGMCPTLAVSTSLINGLSLGLATTLVMALANTGAAAVRNFVPPAVRIPIYILIIATLVTMVDLLMHAYLLQLYLVLGIFIPLIVVNCVILGRAEAFASKNNLGASLLDALGMGLGFTLSLTVLGATREILGNGSLFELRFVSEDAQSILLFILPPGAFIALAYLTLVFNRLTRKVA
jgi:electron transport complex protein RnfE